MKVLLILVDGMRPDALGNVAQAKAILSKSCYTLNAKTVIPSVTLPCHMSLFHSVDPSRHGITTNTYTPQVRPVNGLCEVLAGANKTCAFFYNWEQLRDLTRPKSLAYSCFCDGLRFGFGKANDVVTDAACAYLEQNDTDFAFLYLGYPDDAGHKYGWMSSEYMTALNNCWENITKIVDSLQDDYFVIITADHGGHDRMHGTDMPEDTTIPVIVINKGVDQTVDLSNANIKDLAPTISALLDVSADREWEGTSLLR